MGRLTRPSLYYKLGLPISEVTPGGAHLIHAVSLGSSIIDVVIITLVTTVTVTFRLFALPRLYMSSKPDKSNDPSFSGS